MNKDVLDGAIVHIVEDNEVLSSLIEKKLEMVGAKVQTYQNGLEGLAGIRAHRPDLVLLDIMMPVMNGYEVLEVMSHEHLMDDSPVMVVSNSGQPVEIERVMQLGVRDYVVKVDFTPDEVLEKARAILLSPKITETPAATASASMSQPQIPLTPAEMANTQEASADANGKIKVLVVEDDSMLRNILSVKLTKDGHSPLYVSDGSKAMALAESFVPDVVLLDLMLPGMDGFEILEAMKANDILHNVPVIVFSNKSEETDKNRALSLGAQSYRVKATTDLNDLMRELRELSGQ